MTGAKPTSTQPARPNGPVHFPMARPSGPSKASGRSNDNRISDVRGVLAGSVVDPTETPRQPTKEDGQYAPYSALSMAAYNNPGANLPPPPFTELATQKNTDNGLAGAAYYNPETKELVVAFRGTEPTTWSDLKADANLLFGNKNPQVDDGLAFANKVQQMAMKNGLPVEQITFTGHSLGGAVATEVAALRQLQGGESNRAVVFEGAGSENSLEDRLGRDLTTQEKDALARTQINFMTNTPISSPDSKISATRDHTASLVRLNMGPSKPGADPISNVLEQHSISRVHDIMSSENGIGLDPQVSAAAAEQFKRAYNDSFGAARPELTLKNIHGDELRVRVMVSGRIEIKAPKLGRRGRQRQETRLPIKPEHFNFDLSHPHNQEQLRAAGMRLPTE